MLLKRLRDLNGTSDWGRGLLIGAGFSVLLGGIGVAYSELTGVDAAIRPFLLLALVLSAWFGGRSGGLLATVVALAGFLLYSTQEGGFRLDEEEAWFFAAYASVAVVINLFAAERQRREQRLRRTSKELEESALTQKRLLAEAQASEARHQILADAMPQLVWTATSDGAVTYYNARVRDYDGVVQHEDGSWRWEPVVHPDDLDRTLATWREAATNQQPYSTEHRLRMKDGSYRWHVSRAEPVQQGHETLWFGTATDIERLQRALAAKDEFLGLVSHDLRSPLTTILGNASMLRRGLVEDEGDRLESLIDIETKAKQLAETIEELLELARIQDGALIELEPILIERLVRDALAEEPGLAETGYAVRCGSEAVAVHGNEAYIRRVLHNLVSNALKYGMGSLIEVDIEASHDVVEVQISDRGIGIGEGDAEQLFAPFFRSEDASRLPAPGLGIGLTLCKRLVEAQGGAIGVKARDGGGAVFWFHLSRYCDADSGEGH